MRTILLSALLLALPALSAAQTPCDGPRSDALFVLPPSAPGASFVFSVRTIDIPTLQTFTLRLYRATPAGERTGPPVSAQNVSMAAVTAIGAMQDEPEQTCHSLPVIPVSQIPRGVGLVATLSASGGEPLLASEESTPSNPLGQRFGAPAIRVKP